MSTPEKDLAHRMNTMELEFYADEGFDCLVRDNREKIMDDHELLGEAFDEAVAAGVIPHARLGEALYGVAAGRHEKMIALVQNALNWYAERLAQDEAGFLRAAARHDMDQEP